MKAAAILRRFVLVSTVALLARTSVVAADDSDWRDTQTTSDAIVVRVRRLPGAGLFEVRGSCEVAAPPAKVFEVAMRRDSYDNTTKHVVDYRIVSRESEDLWFTYERLSFPFIADRDYTLRYESQRDVAARRYCIAWSVANDRGPAAASGVVRVATARGRLEMTPMAGGQHTLLVCTTVADPGGWIPRWLANYVNRSTLPNLLRELRDKSEKSQKE